MQFDRITLGRTAKEVGFVRDTFEKVCRLTDVLSFMEKDSLLSECLALKGGTAINLTIFNLPRLSVDIDMDYSRNAARDEMLIEREQINDRILKYMTASGYNLSPKTKNYYALDSFAFEYINAGGMKDNLKIEINYMLRCHVLPVSRRAVSLPWEESDLTVLCVDPVEIFSAKAVALFNRSAARDLYDISNLVKYGLFDAPGKEVFKKCVIFYSAIASETVPRHFDFGGIDRITSRKIKTDLTPVLRRAEHFNLQAAQEPVNDYLRETLLPEGDLSFWVSFAWGEYKPELLFDDSEILARIENHPMALWECDKNRQK